MMSRKWEWIQLGLIGVMFAATAIAWSAVADEGVPVHFGLDGQPDRYGGRFEALAGLPLGALAMYGVLRWLPRLDPLRANYETFARPYAIIRTAVIATLLATHIGLVLTATGRLAFPTGAIAVVVGLLLIAIGSQLGKVRPNWLVGIRTPWTLASKTSWTKTHRMAGFVFIGNGVLWLIAGVAPGAATLVAAIAASGGGVVWTAVYSYLVYRDNPGDVPAISVRPAQDLG